MSPAAHRLVRVALLLVVAGSVGFVIHRLRRTDDQLELTRYVERDLPSLLGAERGVAESLAALLDDKKLPPVEARRKLVDDVNPRIIALRHRAEALAPTTVTVRVLAAEYLRVVDAWADASRAAVRAIDDPKISSEAGIIAVRDRLDEAARASRAFDEHVVSTCRAHRLAPPAR